LRSKSSALIARKYVDVFALSKTQSFGLIDDIPDNSWKMLQTRVRNRINHKHPSNPYSSHEAPQIWFQENFEPDFTCLHEERIGGMGDGAKWVCNPRKLKELALQRARDTNEKCLIYSFGSSGDFSFEASLATLLEGAPCEVHVFDMDDFASLIPVEYKDFIFFHHWGLKGSREQSQFMALQSIREPTKYQSSQILSASSPAAQIGEFHTFQEIVKKLGHKNRTIDVLKIDCEGCEWDTYEDWLQSSVDIRQIQVEMHYVHNHAVHFFLILQRAGFVTFHKEANTLVNGLCYEYAFMKLDEAFFADS